jgi:N-methylhydantoinase A/oxoprolinase/acetone carboxylase beta subunit
MERFLFHTEGRLREHRIRNPLLVFRNDGASSRVAKSSALQSYSSGPRGGVEGTRALARHYGLDDVIMMDVGGTTTDIAVVRHGQVPIARHGRVGEVTTSLPLAQITSHGIGGSSVFRVADGQVTVGPDSVGAAPGPACFGLGGTAATITDVMLLTGVLDAATYLGGSMPLDAARSRVAVQATIADPLGVTVPETLAGMLDAYAQRLADTLRPAATAGATIAAFGGAGPMSVCAAARQASISRVIIPRTAAVFSAFGIGFSDIGHTYSAALPPGTEEEAAEAAGRDLVGQARRDMFAEGIDLARCELTWSLLAAAADGDGPPAALPGPGAAAAALDIGHGGRLQLEVTSVLPHPHLPGTGEAQRTGLVTAGVRDLTGADGSQRTVPVAVLADQTPGAEGAGELIIEGPFFTMLLPAGWHVQLTQGGDMLLTDATAQEAGR